MLLDRLLAWHERRPAPIGKPPHWPGVLVTLPNGRTFVARAGDEVTITSECTGETWTVVSMTGNPVRLLP